MHEQSVTEQIGPDWYNLHGPNTAQPGMPLFPRFGFEQHRYPDVKSADQAATLRSLVFGNSPALELLYESAAHQH